MSRGNVRNRTTKTAKETVFMFVVETVRSIELLGDSKQWHRPVGTWFSKSLSTARVDKSDVIRARREEREHERARRKKKGESRVAESISKRLLCSQDVETRNEVW